MPMYKVKVLRRIKQEVEYTVVALDTLDAEAEAWEIAENDDFSEDSIVEVEEEIASITEVPNE
jgi:hypothetical protein